MSDCPAHWEGGGSKYGAPVFREISHDDKSSESATSTTDSSDSEQTTGTVEPKTPSTDAPKITDPIKCKVIIDVFELIAKYPNQTKKIAAELAQRYDWSECSAYDCARVARALMAVLTHEIIANADRSPGMALAARVLTTPLVSNPNFNGVLDCQ